MGISRLVIGAVVIALLGFWVGTAAAGVRNPLTLITASNNLGTVTATSPNSITVTHQDGTTQTIELTRSTIILGPQSVVPPSRLTLGTSVAVSTTGSTQSIQVLSFGSAH